MGRGGQRPPSLRQLQSPLVGDVAKAGLAPPEPAAERWVLDPKYAIYAFTYLLSLATGAGAHLVPALAQATLLRYLVNHAFVALSKWDAFAEPRRIHRKNPPAQQLERELDWDGPVILSPLAFVLVDLLTPWLRPDRVGPCDARSVAALFAAHYACVEPVYYAFHVWLHGDWAYRRSHGHHHASVVTEAVSGTSHPLAESVAYLANFSLAFLVPAWCGRFSLGQIPLYFVWFDVMNCAGHCNFECFPRWAQWGPLKYYVYTSCYHSLHHSKYKYNYCLFCPIWDHLCGTAHPTSQALHREVTDSARARRPTDVVFLAHGHDVPSMVTHVPFVSPFLCSVTHATGWVATLLWPLCYVWARLAQLLLPATVMQRYQYRGTQAATWCLPVAARFYLNKGERPAIQRKLEAAVDAAERAGVRYVGLAALNKAEWLNGGGEAVRARCEARGYAVKIVHGNALTAAAVLETVRRKTLPEDTVCVTGATAKIGRALAIALARRGHEVVCLTTAPDRFADLVRQAGAAGARLRRAHTYDDAAALRPDVWLLGKLAFESTIHRAVRDDALVVDYAVPHLVPRPSARYAYVNGAALVYDAKDTDLTFCHDVQGTVPACLAAAIVHARDDLGAHETGPIDVDALDGWWARAERHGFRLNPGAAVRCA